MAKKYSANGRLYASHMTGQYGLEEKYGVAERLRAALAVQIAAVERNVAIFIENEAGEIFASITGALNAPEDTAKAWVALFG